MYAIDLCMHDIYICKFATTVWLTLAQAKTHQADCVDDELRRSDE
jgi:hypothetical protein